MSAALPTPYEAVGARLRPVAAPPGASTADAAPLFDLRVLNGAQKDAVVAFGAGRLLVGNDLECDIVLHRPGEPLRAMLSLVDGRLSLAAMSGPLHLNNVAIAPGEGRTVAHGDTIRLADIGLLVSDHVQEDAPPAAANDDGNGAAAGHGAQDAHWFDPGQADAPAALPPETGRTAARQAPRTAPGAAACLALACACLGAWYFATRDDSANYAAALPARRVSSTLPTPASALADAREVLEARRLPGTVDMPSARTLVLTVAPDRLAQARDALGALLSDVNGIDRAEARLRGGAGGLPAISASRGPDGIVISDNLPLSAEAVFSGKNRIVFVAMQPMPSLLTQGGRRLFQGGQLDARTTIERIRPTAVTVTIDGVRRTVAL